MSNTLPRITLLTTGGTIAGQSVAGGGYRAGVLSPEALLAALPALANLAQVRVEAIATIASHHMTSAIWWRLARRIAALFASDAADGVVITHGTDTLEETAYFLSLVLPATRPVVLVGAMRPADALSADGPANLWHAVALAASRKAHGHGPLVVMNEVIYGARDVQKISANHVHAFAAPNGGALGQVYGNTVLLPVGAASPIPARFALPENAAADEQALPRVDIFYACAAQDGAGVDALLAQGVRGIVLAGMGAGTASHAVLAALQRAVQAGVVVLRTSRTGSGYVGAHGEIDDAACGFIAAGRLSPVKARILLMLALAQGESRAKLRQHVHELG